MLACWWPLAPGGHGHTRAGWRPDGAVREPQSPELHVEQPEGVVRVSTTVLGCAHPSVLRQGHVRVTARCGHTATRVLKANVVCRCNSHVMIDGIHPYDRDEPLLTKETMSHVQRLVGVHGVDCWWTMDVADLLPPNLRSQADRCVRMSSRGLQPLLPGHTLAMVGQAQLQAMRRAVVWRRCCRDRCSEQASQGN